MRCLSVAASILAVAVAVQSCARPAEPQPQVSYTAIDQLMQARDHAGAIRLLEEIRSKHGTNADLSLRLAQAYAGVGDLPKALLRCKEGLEVAPDDKRLHLALGNIHSRVSQHPQAREAFEKARALGMSDKYVALPYGTTLGQLNDLDGAEREFEKARAAGEDALVVDYNLALVKSQRKDYVQAQALLERVLAKEPTYAPAKRELARVLLAASPSDTTVVDRAMGLVWDAKEQLSDDWRLFEVMGDGWLLHGDYTAAVTAYTEALRLGKNPKSVEEKYVVAKRAEQQAAAASNGSAPQDSAPVPK